MRIVALSDTHSRHNKLVLPEGDLLLHAGDATTRGNEWEIINFLDWVAKQNFKHKVIVPGNHDWGFQRNPVFFRKEAAARNINLLMEDAVEIEGINFWGSPATPWFYSWAFNYRRTKEEAEKFGDLYWIGDIWKQIPTNTDVLITHGPPMGILDALVYADGTPTGVHAGCDELLKVVKNIKPDLHFFGHIHCGHGEKHVEGTSFYNVSICDEAYYPGNAIRVVEYEK